jgi:DNA polymerase-3 subunit delta'
MLTDTTETASFAGLFGQATASHLLRSALAAERVPHAYLFVGPDGVGKRTAARALARALNCARPSSTGEPCGACEPCVKVDGGVHPDVLSVDFAWQAALLKEPVEKQKVLKIDTLREMEKALRFHPLEGRSKVAVMDPADRLAEPAAHALLKVLEEPPPATHLILLARETSALLPTIRSRCQTVRFRPLTAALIERYLVEAKGYDADDARRAAAAAEGSLSRALELLVTPETVTFAWETAPLSELLGWCEKFQNPRLGRAAAEEFLRALLARMELDLHAGARPPEDLEEAVNALRQVRQNVTPSLVLQVLLLTLRRARRRQAVSG